MKIKKLFILCTTICLFSCTGEVVDKDELLDETEGNGEISLTSDPDRLTPETAVESRYVERYERPATNNPPRIRSITIETITADPRDGFKAVVESDDPEGGEVSYIYQWKHNGTDIIGATGETLEWREYFSKGDELSIEVIPYDEYAMGIWKSEGAIRIPNAPPVIKSSPHGTVSDGRFTYQVKAYDPDEDSITFSLQNEPEGMTIDSKSGEIDWEFSATDAGSYSIDIVVTDEEGAYSVQTISFSISEVTDTE